MIVLDTHALLWFVSTPERLSQKALASVEAAVASEAVWISSISVWEIAMLVSRGRLELTLDVGEWIAALEKLPYFKFTPVDNTLALKAVTLPEPLHNDPADRIIIATALVLGFPLVTKDQKIIDYQHLPTIW